jgi:hypothetical protein
MSDKPKMCPAITKSGKRCAFHVYDNTGYCELHSPDVSHRKEIAKNLQRIDAQKKKLGEEKYKKQSEAFTEGVVEKIQEIERVESIDDVKEAMRLTINDVRQGRLEPKAGSVVSTLGTVLVKCFEFQRFADGKDLTLSDAMYPEKGKDYKSPLNKLDGLPTEDLRRINEILEEAVAKEKLTESMPEGEA